MPIPIPTVYRLTFKTQPGIMIVCKSAPLGTLQKMASMGIDPNDEKGNRKSLGYFAKKIIDWNVDHKEIEQQYEDEEITDTCSECGLKEGDRLPISAKGLGCIDIDFVQLIVMSWMGAVTRVSPPKDENSSSGGSDTDTLTNTLGSLQSPVTSEMLNSSLV